jgi:hypothetical protein
MNDRIALDAHGDALDRLDRGEGGQGRSPLVAVRVGDTLATWGICY